MTIEEKTPPTVPANAGECNIDGRAREHSPDWVWENGKWTDRVRCATCGKEWQHGK